MRYFVLVGRRVRRATLMEWALFLGRTPPPGRVVAQTIVSGFRVSTVFTGFDYSFGAGQPRVWETMVFNDDTPSDAFDCNRCAGSWDQAEEMHERMVRAVEASCGIERTANLT